MKTRRIRIIGVAVGVALLAGGGVGWHRLKETRAAAVAALPATPDLRAWPDTLREQVGKAERETRSLFHAGAGLAELSRLYHANGFLREAARCYGVLAWIQPGEARWPHRHATILAGFGETGPALALERRAVELAPDYLPARLRLGDLLLKSNRPEDAASVYEEVLRKKDREPYAELGLARVDFEAARWEKARQRLEPLVEQTNFNLGYDLIVTVYEKLGMDDRAAGIRSQRRASGAFRDAPDPWIDELYADCFDTYRLGVAAGMAARVGDLDTAMNLLERAVDLNPRDLSSVFQLGGLCRERKEFSRARLYFQQCTELDPTFADGWANLSALLLQLNDPAGAERALASGLARCPESPGLHLMRARKLVATGRRAEAVEEYRLSTRFRANEAEAFIELAGVLFDLGRMDEGLREMEKSLVAEPENPAALSLMAFHAISTGDETGARRWLARVRNQPRVSAEQVERLRQAYRQKFGKTL